jgi:hypothetical protein
MCISNALTNSYNLCLFLLAAGQLSSSLIVIMQVSKIVFVVLVVSQAFLTFVSATVEVFDVKTEWEARVASCITNTFEDKNTPLIADALTDLGLFSVSINVVQQGQLGRGQLGLLNGVFTGLASTRDGRILNFEKFDKNGPIIGFAGDWESTSDGGLLTVKINGGVTITFGDILKDIGGSKFGNLGEIGDDLAIGNGFFGFVVEAGIDILEFGSVNGFEVFFLDNARTAGQCTPPTDPRTEEIRPDFKAENQISSADAVTFVTDGLASAVAFNNNAGTIISSKFADFFAAFGGV